MLQHQMTSKSAGFSLLELLVGMVIVSISLSAAIPSYVRNMRQKEVDRYTQQLEAGFFGLRAKLGQQKTSCTLNFDQNGLSNFVTPADLVEMQDHRSGSNAATVILKLQDNPAVVPMDRRLGRCWPGVQRGRKRKIIRDRSLRLLDREGTPESESVEVSVNLASYELTPPGTSTMSNDLIFVIRSTNTQEQRLRTRCLQISGTGTIVRASWDASTSSCMN